MLPIHPCHEQRRYERAKDLGNDVVRDLFPGEPLPNGETDGDSGIEVTTGRWSAGDDGKHDAKSKGPADLEDGAEGCCAQGASSIEDEAGNGCDAWEAIQELFGKGQHK